MSTRSTLTSIAKGEINPDRPDTVISGIIRSGILSRDFIASMMGVQPGQVVRVAASMKPRQLREICSRALQSDPALVNN